MVSGARKRICINTGGGDAPGLNAVIRSVVYAAHRRGWEVYGSRNGYEGFLDTDAMMRLTPELVANIMSIGGTILGTTNKGNPFKMPVTNLAGETEIRDVSDRVMETYKRMRFDCLVAVGGDGSLTIANGFAQKGMRVIGVPKTIDNDLMATVVTFGYDTAVATATDAIDKLHSTARSHERVLVVEVMGRHAGWIALNSGLSGGADVILIPEIPFDPQIVCDYISELYLTGKKYAIVVAAEGATPKGGEAITRGSGEVGRQAPVLGGIADWLAKEISRGAGKDTRSLVLGHLQRGGSPSSFDRLIAQRFGCAAIRFIENDLYGHMVSLRPPEIVPVPLAEVTDKMKLVPIDSDNILTARDLGICLGDAPVN